MANQVTTVKTAAQELQKTLIYYHGNLENDFDRAVASAQWIWSEKTVELAIRRMHAKLDATDVPFVLLDIMKNPTAYGEVRREGFWPFYVHTRRAEQVLKAHYEQMLSTQRLWVGKIEMYSQMLLDTIRAETTTKAA